MNLPRAKGAHADDLAARIHREGGTFAAAEGAEVDHPARLRPAERMNPAAGSGTSADDTAARIHRLGPRAAAEGAEVDHPARLRPRERAETAARVKTIA